MSTLPTLITDLALIMITAGITTLLFKKLNQPLVLGYIVAGILVGPVISFFPTISDLENIKTLADIGVIFLMFGLGLEFSLHKLAQVGKTAFNTAITTIVFMLALGFAIGMMLGWGRMNSIFLGGMICMSSTIIIIKALGDLGMRHEPFAEGILGVLVLEDVAAIFLMVVLSTISVSQGTNGISLAGTLGTMVLYLALWLILGIYLLPTFFKKVKGLMSDETVLIVSVGLCFGMVWLAEAIGFSSALGAFLAGSILAGTTHAERISKLITPCKDLFAAVFFVSVGMMVSPSKLVEYFFPILIITVAVMLGQMASVALGMIISGKNFSFAVKSGSAMCQIGEFSFIIASLGMSLGVTDDFLYPVVVAVSVITTFATPYWIKGQNLVETALRNVIPNAILHAVDSPPKHPEKKRTADPDWKAFRTRYIKEFGIYGVIVAGATLVLTKGLMFFLAAKLNNTAAAEIILGIVGIALAAPFVRPLTKTSNRYFTALFLKNVQNRWKLGLLSGLRIVFCAICIAVPLQLIFPIPYFAAFIGGLLLDILFIHSDWLEGVYFAIETRFLSNFNEKKLHDLMEDGRRPLQRWMEDNLFVDQFLCGAGSDAVGLSLRDLKWSTQMHVNVIKILRGEKHINIPNGFDVLHEGDRIYIMGEKKQLENFETVVMQKNHVERAAFSMLPLSDFLEQEENVVIDEDKSLLCRAIQLESVSKFVGKSIADVGIRARWNCSLAGIERGDYPLPHPNPKRLLMAGDVLWLLGSKENLDQIRNDNEMTNAELMTAESNHVRRLRKLYAERRDMHMRH